MSHTPVVKWVARGKLVSKSWTGVPIMVASAVP